MNNFFNYHHQYLNGFFILLIIIGVACTRNTPPNITPPGDEKTGKAKVLETGAELLQNEAPINQISMYLDGFHFANGDMNHQMEAHHYCTQLNDDVTQCMIYDGNTADALLIGVEYIISEKLFKTLPREERQLWHSHDYEVKSGQLIAPGIPQLAEHELMEKLVSTYGKTWHTWQTNTSDSLPTGTPNLMMGFTADGQIEQTLLKDRDERFNVSTTEKKENRADIPKPEVLAGANAWQEGIIKQLPSLTEGKDEE
ncbi:hypothetical protein OKW21_003160 [Catalinimonas alkaloidigena]|uniref:OBAP family protein n=1 Tax=Catalinimonas alkaloidigena TaxID=1075417 RepID=UPI0024053D5F|nr:OBAP family protein [Catalinimonas alkaloidigena]MDF9797897.1 hypothetical protein [Catalinimonas alkaloidigena]